MLNKYVSYPNQAFLRNRLSNSLLSIARCMFQARKWYWIPMRSFVCQLKTIIQKRKTKHTIKIMKDTKQGHHLKGATVAIAHLDF